MTMGDESLYAAMTIPVVIGPILERVSNKEKLFILLKFLTQILLIEVLFSDMLLNSNC